MAEKKWVVALIEMDEDGLSSDGFARESAVSSVPQSLCDAIQDVSPSGALDLKVAFLVAPEAQPYLLRYLNHNSLPYHRYAVDERGEKCTKLECKEHGRELPGAVVIRLHDRRKRSQSAG